MFFEKKRETEVPPHPRREPRIALPLSLENLKRTFCGCVDFACRDVALAGDEARRITLCYLNGMVKMERVSDYVLGPMARDGARAACPSRAGVMEQMEAGALYNLGVERREDMDGAVADLIGGSCLLLFPGESAALSFNVGTEEKRSITPPGSETVLKGARDSFVESIRTNTSMVRRHLKAPELKIGEHIVGRQSLTAVDVLYLEGIANPETAALAAARVEKMDIDALLATGNLEEYIIDRLATPFPLVQYTERPDRFCAGLAEGRVGLLIDGLPLGYLVPGTLGDFLRAPQDKSNNWMVASVLTVLRYVCMLVTLILPAFYVAVVTFHQEMIPTRLALSIIAAKQNVPFVSAVEVIILLVAFEILQEAGLRLPQSIGQTVSIIGGLVVGTAAVEAKIISPAVLIVVAVAGIAGYTMPSQELAGALRIWRFVLVVLGSIGGLFAMMMGIAVLVGHLAGIESFGVAYLTPFAANGGREVEGHPILRQPLPRTKLRPAALKPRNRRNQG